MAASSLFYMVNDEYSDLCARVCFPSQSTYNSLWFWTISFSWLDYDTLVWPLQYCLPYYSETMHDSLSIFYMMIVQHMDLFAGVCLSLKRHIQYINVIDSDQRGKVTQFGWFLFHKLWYSFAWSRLLWNFILAHLKLKLKLKIYIYMIPSYIVGIAILVNDCELFFW